MITSISWKNIWRNKYRSLIIMIALTLGIFGGIILLGFVRGMMKQRTDSALKTEVSHLQIHKPEYQINNDFKHFIANADEVVRHVRENEHVQGVSKRIVINTLAKTSENGVGVRINGIDPEEEKKVSDLYTKVIEGEYFEQDRRNPIVVGEKLAEKLGVGIKSKIILEIQDTSGMFIPANFKVVGIYKTSNLKFDERQVFVRNSDLVTLTGLEEQNAHEIAIFMTGREHIEALDDQLEKEYPGLSIETWKEGNLMLAYMADMMNQYTMIFMLFILGALFFGIVNTMLMAILERRKEIGMLMAIGMKRLKVFLMIMYETVMLSLTGAIIGIVIGYLAVWYFAINGLDLSIWAKGLESVGYDPVVYFDLDFASMVTIVVMVIVTGVLASIYPAIKALRLKPVEAIRIDN